MIVELVSVILVTDDSFNRKVVAERALPRWRLSKGEHLINREVLEHLQSLGVNPKWAPPIQSPLALLDDRLVIPYVNLIHEQFLKSAPFRPFGGPEDWDDEDYNLLLQAGRTLALSGKK